METTPNEQPAIAIPIVVLDMTEQGFVYLLNNLLN